MGPELLMAGIILIGLALYAVLGGADFGAGVWEFNLMWRVGPEERDLVNRAIGPVWEANHVWLIFVIVGLFSAFPAAFAALGRALWVPLLLAVVGIVFRGVAFAFRSPQPSQLWNTVFGFASCAAPFFLGMSAWSVATATPWYCPVPIFGGFFGVAICAYLASVYLTREASGDLRERWRHRAFWSGAWMGVLAAGGVAIVAWGAPDLWRGFRERSWPFVALSAAAGVASMALLWVRRHTLASIFAAAAVGAVILGWGLGQYPVLVPPSITVETARAPANVHWTMAAVMGVGALFVLPALGYLLYIFKRRDSAS